MLLRQHRAIRRVSAFTCLLTVLLLAGCSRHQQSPIMRLDPKSPAAAGLPLDPGPDQPSPLKARPPFGLYAHYPDDDTLGTLSKGTLSPDGRFRFAMSTQGLWVTRVDAAWLWEVQLPAITATPVPSVDGKANPDPKANPPQSPPAQTGPAPGQAPPQQKARALAGPPHWSPRGNLLLQDSTGAWYEANPGFGTVAVLPAYFTGAQLLTPSPDGSQYLFYRDGKAGKQLWTAKADGAGAKLVGENVAGQWDPVKGTVLTQANEKIIPGKQTTAQHSRNLTSPTP